MLLTVEDVARYFVRDGREIVVDSIGSERDVRAFLLGSALAACLQQRGVFTLYASAVETECGAALFAGERGAGKSTLAAALVDRGFRLMADDVTGIVVREDRPVALPAFPSMRLWGDAMQKLGRRSTDGAKAQANVEKYNFPVERFCDSPLPVCAIFVLSLHNRDAIRLEAVPPVAAFEALLSHTYRKRFAHAMARLPEQYRATTALARHAPLFTLVRPVEQGDPAPLADAVERQISLPMVARNAWVVIDSRSWEWMVWGLVEVMSTAWPTSMGPSYQAWRQGK